MTTLAFKASYSDWKLIKTRGVVQVVMEIPLAEADAAYKVLGGMPDFSRETWFAVAPLKPESEVMPDSGTLSRQHNAKPQPKDRPAGVKREWRDLLPTEQSGMRCDDARFHAFLLEEYGFDTNGPEQAAIVVRQLCKVESRKEFNIDPLAKVRWNGLDDQFLAWMFTDA